MTTTPALYEVTIRHTRVAPMHNAFRYRSFSWLVDIGQPPRLPFPLRGLAHFDARDHLDVRAQLAAHDIATDRVLMLANARMLGYVFNPITVFWCYQGDKVVAVVAEVHNTYAGRHAYVLRPDDTAHAEVDKQFYVSPFNDVTGRYRIHVPEPTEQLSVTVTLEHPDRKPFVATMVGERRPVTSRSFIWLCLRYPWAPLRVSALIRWQGVRLWRRGLRVVPR